MRDIDIKNALFYNINIVTSLLATRDASYAIASGIKAICIMNFTARIKVKEDHYPYDTKRNVIKVAIEFPVVASCPSRISSRLVSCHFALIRLRSVKIWCVKRD